MALSRNKNIEKFTGRHIPYNIEAGIHPHPLHPERDTLNHDINLADDKDNRGVVKTIVASDYGDLYSVALDPSDHDVFDSMYEQTNKTIYELSCDQKQASKNPERLILKAAYQTVRKSMKTISRDESVKYVQKYAPPEDNTLVSIEAFVRDGVGASEHQAMAAAGLLRRFTNIGALKGEINIDTSIRDDSRTNKRLHDSWLRHTDELGNVTIIDPANNYFGSLYSSITNSKIDYIREEDLEDTRIFDKAMDVINQISEREAKAKEGIARKFGQNALNGWHRTEEKIERGFLAYNKFIMKPIEKLLPEENSTASKTLKTPDKSQPD